MAAKKIKMVLPRWVRLRPDGQEKVHEMWLAAYDEKADENWLWFCEVVDYRESCARTSRFQTWRTFLVRFLLFLVERLVATTESSDE